jgi:putative tricarboxylic transport membrane protein
MKGGLSFMPLLIGLFAISEVIMQFERHFTQERGKETRIGETSTEADEAPQSNQGMTFREMKSCAKIWLRSSLIGTFIGALPGVGSSVSPFIAYSDAKAHSKHPEEYGKGALEGVVACESANNAVCGANLIPLLTLGIPGDVVAAMLGGALVIHGMRPGPLFLNETPQFLYAIFAILLICNVTYLIFGSIFIKLALKITRYSTKALTPIIVTICVAAAYAFDRSVFDIKIMVIFGLIGYVMRKLDFGLPAFIIAFILSPMFETSLRRALVLSKGDFSIFVTRPISLLILIILVIILTRTAIKEMRSRKKAIT